MTEITCDGAVVTLSGNETESLGMKAARGAGFSWGLAEEVGFAAGWLAANGLNGAAPLLKLLSRKLQQSATIGMPKLTAGHWQSVDGNAICPIQLGVALVDRAAMKDEQNSAVTLLDPVKTPLLLLPFLVRLAQISKRSLILDWQGGSLDVASDGFFDKQGAAAWIDLDLLDLTITSSLNVNAQAHTAKPAPLPSILKSTMTGLAKLALKTTVPATNASRSGAGSATNDND